jgi:hypothetical protein
MRPVRADADCSSRELPALNPRAGEGGARGLGIVRSIGLTQS